MNNKGYTLVELLAVFVVLGVMIMISVPIISGVINTSKEKSYNEQVKILEDATRTYMSRNSKELPSYENTHKCITVEKLKSDGFISNKNIKNPVGKTENHEEKDEFFNGGVLVSYIKDKYTYKYVDDCGSEEFVVNSVVYSVNRSNIHLGDSVVSEKKWCAESSEQGNSCDYGFYFESEDECNQYLSDNDIEATCGEKNTLTSDGMATAIKSCEEMGVSSCIRYTISNNIVTGAEVCFIKDGTERCLQGWKDECLFDFNYNNGIGECTFTGIPTVFNSNKAVLQDVFTEENACSEESNHFYCHNQNLSVDINNGGDVFASEGVWKCNITSEGSAKCDEIIVN